MTRLQPVSYDSGSLQEILKPNISHVDYSKA